MAHVGQKGIRQARFMGRPTFPRPDFGHVKNLYKFYALIERYVYRVYIHPILFDFKNDSEKVKIQNNPNS